MAVFKFGRDKALAAFGPQAADGFMRQALRTIWMLVPESKRTEDEVERIAKAMLERAVRDFRSDLKLFIADPTSAPEGEARTPDEHRTPGGE